MMPIGSESNSTGEPPGPSGAASENELSSETGIPECERDIVRCMLLDAMYLRDKEHKFTEKHIKLYHIYYNYASRSICAFVGIIYLLLLVFEDSDFNFGFDLKYILYAVEMLCILYFGFNLVLIYLIYESKLFWKGVWNKACLIFLVWSFIDLNIDTFWMDIPRFSRAFRPIIVISRFRNIRHLFTSFGKSISKSYETVVMLLVFVFIWGLLGHMLFTDWNHPPAYPGPVCSVFLDDDCNDYFSNPFQAVWQIYTLLSTVNFPDVMLPYLNNKNSILPSSISNIVTSLYFVIYIWIALFVLLKLMYAIMFSAYQNYNDYIFGRKKQRKETTYKKVFDKLSKHHPLSYITASEWKDMFHLVRPDLKEEHIDLFYKASIHNTVSNTNYMFERDFIKSCEYLTVRVRELPLKRTSTYSSSYFNKFFTCLLSKLNLDAPFQTYIYTPLSNYYSSSYASVITNIMIYIQLVLVLFQINNYSSIPLCDFLLKWIYIVSILDKLLCFLFIDPIQLRDKWIFHLTDCCCLLLSCLSYFVLEPVFGFYIYDINTRGSWLSNLLILLRLVRIITPIIYILSPYLSILSTVGGLFVRCLLILFSIMYIFCVLGHNLFGYKLVPSNPDVRNSSYGQSDFYAMNFDDPVHSFATLFYMLVVNNWPILAEGCEAAVGPLSRLFFVVFYVVANILFMNCTSAFIVSTMFGLIGYKISLDHGKKEDWQVKLEAVVEEETTDRYVFYKKFSTSEIIRIYLNNK